MECDACPKVPHDAEVRSRFNRVELDARGEQAYRWFKRCRVMNHWPAPDDEAQGLIADAVLDGELAAEQSLKRRDDALLERRVELAVLKTMNR